MRIPPSQPGQSVVIRQVHHTAVLFPSLQGPVAVRSTSALCAGTRRGSLRLSRERSVRLEYFIKARASHGESPDGLHHMSCPVQTARQFFV